MLPGLQDWKYSTLISTSPEKKLLKRDKYQQLYLKVGETNIECLEKILQTTHNEQLSIACIL